MRSLKKKFIRRFRQEHKNRINTEIKAKKVRLVSDTGSEVLLLEEVLKKAQDSGEDVVEIVKNRDFPVVKIIDYGKFKFAKAKKEKENRKKQKVTHLKEIKMGPKIDSNDFDRKCGMARNFLEGGDTVKITTRFKGREMAHTELGLDKMNLFYENLNSIALLDRKPVLEGRIMSMVLKARSLKTKSN